MKTRVYAVAETVPANCDYLTAGKRYEVSDDEGGLFYAVCDSGDNNLMRWRDCPHLDGGDWTRIEEPAWSDADIDRMAEAGRRMFICGTDADVHSTDIWRGVVRAVLQEAGL